MKLKQILPPKEQLEFLVTLAHNEYTEEVIAGESPYYEDWLKFIAECALQMILPEQRHG